MRAPGSRKRHWSSSALSGAAGLAKRARVSIRTRSGGKFSLNRGRIKFKRGSKDVVPSTFQNDLVTVYNRRPAPRAVKRRARARAMSIQKTIAAQYPTNVFRFNYSFDTFSPSNNQAFAWLPIYSGSIGTPLITFDRENQLQHIFDYARQLSARPIDTSPRIQGSDQKLLFTNCVMNGVFSLTTASDLDTPAPAIIDVYHLWARRDSPLNAPQLFDFGIQKKAQGASAGTTGLQVPTVSNAVGITPFQSSELCQHFIIRSVRRIKVSDTASERFELTLKDNKNYTIQVSEFLPSINIVASPLPTLRKYTEGYLLIFRGVPLEAQVSSSPVNLRGNVNVEYHYKMLNNQMGSAVQVG